ncbi:progressive ankylosis protein homolog B-like isoform X2 [Ptychodera flava]|uniref:progressive ankylosis protein homolog B-like isoform X2 n=1 Tax=Ptychodera flava TaxID=63121 RepID=UPI003969F2DD
MAGFWSYWSLVKYFAPLALTIVIQDVGEQIGVVAGLLQTSLGVEGAILIPVIALYSGCLVRLGILVGGVCKFVTWEYRNSTPPDETRDRLSAGKVFGLWWPLALVQCIQGITRPVINVFVARDLEDTPEEAVTELAVLTLAYPVGRVPWGWLNELKTVVPAFLQEPAADSSDQTNQVTSREIRIFHIWCLLLSMTFMFVVFWIPGIITSFLVTVLDADPWLAELCVVPLKIFTFCAIPVTILAYVTSWLLLYKQTKFLAPSAVVRIVTVILALVVLPLCGVYGASQGVGALLAAFCGEAATAAIGYVYVKRKRERRRAVDERTPLMTTDTRRND